jgi:hypothetical protein
MEGHRLKVNTAGDLGSFQIALTEITDNIKVGWIRSPIRHSICNHHSQWIKMSQVVVL